MRNNACFVKESESKLLIFPAYFWTKRTYNNTWTSNSGFVYMVASSELNMPGEAGTIEAIHIPSDGYHCQL